MSRKLTDCKWPDCFHCDRPDCEYNGMPRDTGALQNESTFVDYSNSSQGSCSIVSDTPYARRLYYHPEYQFSKDENPNARGKWYEPWMKGGEHETFARDTFKKNYKKEAGLW